MELQTTNSTERHISSKVSILICCFVLLTFNQYSSSPPEINDFLLDDLSLTTTALKQHPKVYWIWNHRRWCLESVPDGPSEDDPDGWRKSNWNKELYVVDKMLELDPRNCETRTQYS